VIASHVIEHVPDVIGWLAQIAELSADGACLLLAVPDRRYCFDRHRPATTVGQALQAHELAETRPSTRAIYDHYTEMVNVDTAALWAGARPPGRGAHVYRLADASAAVDRGRAGEYVDSHVWTFTPWAFLELIQDLRRLSLCDWYVERIEPRVNDVEFHAVLRRGHRDGRAVAVKEPQPPSELPGWLYDESAPLYERIEQLAAQVAAQRERITRLRRRNERLRERVRVLDVSVQRRIRDAVKRRIRR
jgi:hypothetical protein